MKKKRLKKVISMAMIGILVLCGITGCKKEGKEENVKEARGRYVEEFLELPLQEGERGVGLLQKEDGGLKVYTYLQKEKKYQAYETSDGKQFTEGKADWLNNFLGGEDSYLKDIFQGEDGNEYVFYYKDETLHLIKSTDGSDVLEVLPELFGDLLGVDMVRVMENGDIVASDAIKGKLDVYSAEDGSHLKSMEQGSISTSDVKLFDYQKGKAIVLNKGLDGFLVYDLEKEEATQEISYGSMKEGDGILKIGKEEDCFLLNSQGLHHINKSGSTVETLIEGDMASMGDASMEEAGFAIGENRDYFALYNQENQGMLAHYVYDKEAKVSADEQLTIYGLEENKTIKQAVARFQKEHPQVRVHYKTGSQQETSTTKADQIRVLNTELLSGNGADILVLDGLPVDSYIEKGVLEDMTDFYAALSKESPLLENITKSMKKDALYGMPVRAKVLGIYGSEEEVEAMKSLKNLQAFLEGSGEKSLLYATSYEQYLKLLLTLNYKEMFPDSGKKEFSEKTLQDLLKTTKELGEAMGVESYSMMEFYLKRMPDMTEESLEKEMGVDTLKSISTNNDMEARNQKQAVVVEAGGVYDLMMPCAVMQELNTTLQGVRGLYIPNGVVGMNSGSKNKELAEEFLKLLFSEDIQSLDLGDGFPVNENALETWCQKESSEDGSGLVVGGSDENGEMFSASEPDGTQIKPFAEAEKAADTPVQIDEAILEVIVDEGTAYFKGEKSLEEAVQNITNKTETYLQEQQ